jgi:hypothetical protein
MAARAPFASRSSLPPVRVGDQGPGEGVLPASGGAVERRSRAFHIRARSTGPVAHFGGQPLAPRRRRSRCGPPRTPGAQGDPRGVRLKEMGRWGSRGCPGKPGEGGVGRNGPGFPRVRVSGLPPALPGLAPLATRNAGHKGCSWPSAALQTPLYPLPSPRPPLVWAARRDAPADRSARHPCSRSSPSPGWILTGLPAGSLCSGRLHLPTPSAGNAPLAAADRSARPWQPRPWQLEDRSDPG